MIYEEHRSILSSPDLSSENKKNKLNADRDISKENTGVYDIKVCPICLEFLDVNKNDKSYLINLKTDSVNNNQNNINNYSCNGKLMNNYNNLNNNNNSGFITMLCGHTFHIECCLKFQDEKCPICRYYISPISVSTCSLCTAEDDLWLCLICGNINCGSEGNSNEHRKQHFINTGHVYSKKLGDYSNITFDLSRNTNLNTWFQQNIYSNFCMPNADDSSKINLNGNINSTNNLITSPEIQEITKNRISINNRSGMNIDKENSKIPINDSDNQENLIEEIQIFYFSKTSKDKLDYIITEYNSIITSQLESQRFFFLEKIKNSEEIYSKKITDIDKEIQISESDKINKKQVSIVINQEKLNILEQLKENENLIKIKSQEYSQIDLEYKSLLNEKNNNAFKHHNKEKYIREEIDKIEEETQNLKKELKDLKIHFEIKKNKKINEISGGSFRTLEFQSKRQSNQKKNQK